MEIINSRQPRAIASWIRLGALAVIAAAPTLAQFTFTTFDVPGTSGTGPGAINNNGDIAGTYSNGSGTSSGFIRKANGTFTLFDLSSVNGSLSAVTGINDLDEVVGTGVLNNVAFPLANVGFVRDAEGNIATFSGQAVSLPDNGVRSVAGINNAGESVVEFQNGIGFPSFFLRSAANTYKAIGSPATNIFLVPYAGLNNNGEVVGTELANPSLGLGQAQGFLVDLTSQQRGATFDFSTGFTGPDIPPPHTTAVAVNDSGIVLGNYLSGADLTIPGLPPTGGSYQSVSYLRGADGSLLLSFVPPFPSHYVQGLNNSGEIVGGYSDANGGHGYIGTPSPSTAQPNISLIQVIPGPPEQAVFSVVDPVAGLFSVLTIANNCTVIVAPFSPGQTTPVTVTAYKRDQALKAIIGIEASNMGGNITNFDPTFVTVYGTGGSPTEPLSDVPASEHVLMVANGDPGLEKLNVMVNGKNMVVSLKPNEKRTLNLQAWMTLANNSVTFSGEGSPNAYASVVLRDGAARPSRSFGGHRDFVGLRN